MADDTHSGAFSIDGQWVTAIRYEALLDAEGKLANVKLAFMNGRRRVETAELPTRELALELLGSRNVAAIEAGTGLDKAARPEAPRGRLQGRTLAFHAADTQTLEEAAVRSIEANRERLLASDGLGETQARERVRQDAGALRSIRDETERAFAAATIGEHAHRLPAYRLELLRQAPELAQEVAAAFAVEQARIAAKEARKTAQAEAIAARLGTSAPSAPGVRDAFVLNGEPVTAIRYEARVKDARVIEAALKFMNGAGEVAAFAGDREEALALLGERNLAAIESAAGERDDTVKGELRGARLQPREVLAPQLAMESLPGPSEATADGPDNSVERDSVSGGREAGVSNTRANASVVPPGPAPTSEPGGEEPNAGAFPLNLERRFIRVRDRFYFPDRSLAFTDRGTQLKAESENAEVIRSLVEIACARGWEAIRVKGTETFRSKVWQEAARLGIAVRGYVPSEVERAQLAREHPEHALGSPAPQLHGNRPDSAALHSERSSPAAGESSRNARTAPPRRGEGQPTPTSPDVIFGKLIETGEAPYRFQDHAGPSPYIRIATDKGERVLWGVDFPRAVAEAQTQPRPGDPVGVQYLGKRAVTVKVPVKDQDGSVKAYKEISTHRNTWAVEKPQFYQAREERAAAIRNTETAREQLVESHPELAAAITWIHLAERLAARSIADPRDQERFVAMVREGLAQAIGRSKPLAPPKLRVLAPGEPVRNEDRVPPGHAMRRSEKVMAR